MKALPYMVSLVLAGLCALLWLELQQRSRVNELVGRTIESNNIVERKVDQMGREVVTATSNYLTREQLRESSDRTIDSLRKEMRGALGKIERVTTLTYEKVSSMRLPLKDTVVVVGTDTVRTTFFSYRSEYMDMKGFVLRDSLHLDYSIRGDFSLEYSWEAPRLFGPRELSLTVMSNDPAVRIGKVQQFQVVEPLPVWRRPGVAFVAGMVALGAVQLTLK